MSRRTSRSSVMADPASSSALCRRSSPTLLLERPNQKTVRFAQGTSPAAASGQKPDPGCVLRIQRVVNPALESFTIRPAAESQYIDRRPNRKLQEILRRLEEVPDRIIHSRATRIACKTFTPSELRRSPTCHAPFRLTPSHRFVKYIYATFGMPFPATSPE